MFCNLRYGFRLVVCLALALMLQQCANMVMPTGGPKDKTPPVVTEVWPENHSTNFSSRKIEITYDEFVVLENAKQNVLVSPPLKETPDIKLNNKTLSIRFKETLKPNTTYTIKLGEAIKDLHEGNVFKDYEYTFSTGDFLDTLTIAGKVINADDGKIVNDAWVGLYYGDSQGLDSLPMTSPPDYITKTDKEGKFTFSGLADKAYLVYALKDANSNLYFDLPNEQVAFLDTLVQAVPLSLPQSKPAQNRNDSLSVADTTSIRIYDMKARELVLHMFTETDTTQMLMEKKLVEEGLLRFVFRQPAYSVSIETPETLPDTFCNMKVYSTNGDTISWYFTPKVKDSLWVQIKGATLNDSTRYALVSKEKKRNNSVPVLKVSNNIENGILLPESMLTLRFSEPVTDFRLPDSSVCFIAGNDTLHEALEFEKTDEYGMTYRLVNELKNDVEYNISITDSAFFSLRQLANNAINLKFHLAKEEEYGNIFITINPEKAKSQIVVQLLNERGKLIDTQIVDSKKELEFWNLAPGKYRLKAILDTDGNGKWSNGNFHRHFLPETIINYKDELDLKAGWDIDLEKEWIVP